MSSLNRGKLQPGGPGGPSVPSRGPVTASLIAKSGASSAASSGQLPSSQYLDAINVLCENTMAEACALCLAPPEDSTKNNGNVGKSNYQKLLEIEAKCRNAVKVIQKEAITPPPAASNMMLPPSMPTIPAARVNPAATKKATKGNNPTAKALMGKTASATGKPVVPIRRGSLAGARGDRPVAGLGNHKRSLTQQQQLQRANSDESANAGNNPNKKTKLTPFPPSKNMMPGNNNEASSTGASAGDAPPPSALDFLKKLNQGDKKADSKQSKKEKGAASTAAEDAGENLSEAESSTSDNSSARRGKNNTSPTNKPPRREGVRKNPSRGAKR